MLWEVEIAEIRKRETRCPSIRRLRAPRIPLRRLLRFLWRGPGERLPCERSWLWWGRIVCHQHSGPLVADLVDIEPDPEGFVIGAEGKEATEDHGACLLAVHPSTECAGSAAAEGRRLDARGRRPQGSLAPSGLLPLIKEFANHVAFFRPVGPRNNPVNQFCLGETDRIALPVPAHREDLVRNPPGDPAVAD